MLQDAGTSFLITSEAIKREFQSLPAPTLTPADPGSNMPGTDFSSRSCCFPTISPETVCTSYTGHNRPQPKVVRRTHANLFANVIAMDVVSDFGREDNFLAVLPMFHSFGWTTSVFAAPLPWQHHKSTDRFLLKEVLQVLSEEKVTIFCASSSMFS